MLYLATYTNAALQGKRPHIREPVYKTPTKDRTCVLHTTIDLENDHRLLMTPQGGLSAASRRWKATTLPR